MERLDLKYGLNPNQTGAYIYRKGGLPIKVINGRPGYINLLDALNAWQLVRELKASTGLEASASFKHVSPAGAALSIPLTEDERKMYFAPDSLSPLATAYVRARGADRMSSFGDFIALSDICDESTASVIAKEVSDGIIAPGYSEEALDMLCRKKKGQYTVMEIDPCYEGDVEEIRTVFGITFSEPHNTYAPSDVDFSNIVTKNRELPESAILDLKVALITLKYTQSNSVCFARHGQTIGVGAGQQSRIHCTRLAAGKADMWHLRQSEQVLSLPFLADIRRPDRDNAIDLYLSDEEWEDVLADGAWQKVFRTRPKPLLREDKQEWLANLTQVTVGSDAFFPFGDNVERAHRSGAAYIVQPGGSIRDDHVIATCDKYGMVMAFTGLRLFHH